MSIAAKTYILSIMCLGAGLAVSGLSSLPDSAEQWLLFAALLACTATAQLFPVSTPKNQAYYVSLVFMFAGVLLLPTGALALLVVICLIPEWIKLKYRWYIQLFNMANFLVSALMAREFYAWFAGGQTLALISAANAVAAVLAAALFTILNHVLLAAVLRLARSYSWKETLLFEPENLLTDATLACTGIITALLWQINPWLVSLVIAVLYLLHRALNTPNLLEQARSDDKTGLYNARHFDQTLREELRRASRFDRPLAVIVADMDLLRNINNTYGHLAGDAVLKGVAEIVKNSLREYDLAARFGGEEFAVLLPETGADQALSVAERIRKQVEEARFVVPTSMEPIRATLSLGVASFPSHGSEPNEIMHQADLAVYHAKLKGRNHACICSAESAALNPTMSLIGSHIGPSREAVSSSLAGRECTTLAGGRGRRLRQRTGRGQAAGWRGRQLPDRTTRPTFSFGTNDFDGCRSTTPSTGY